MTKFKRMPVQARLRLGIALGNIYLTTGEGIDNRRGVGLREDGLPDIEWVAIPEGRVILGENAGEKTVKPFKIAKYLITNAKYQAFIDDQNGYANQKWWDGIEYQAPTTSKKTESNSPRETVSWYDAIAFCRWVDHCFRKQGLINDEQQIRLPDEFEWQQAASKGKAWAFTFQNKECFHPQFPWSNNFRKYDSGWGKPHCNCYDTSFSGLEKTLGDRHPERGFGRTTAVGLYPHATWSGGPLDMIGNVAEWCLNRYSDPTDTRAYTGERRTVRGGHFHYRQHTVSNHFRRSVDANERDYTNGFRLCLSSPIAKK